MFQAIWDIIFGKRIHPVELRNDYLTSHYELTRTIVENGKSIAEMQFATYKYVLQIK